MPLVQGVDALGRPVLDQNAVAVKDADLQKQTAAGKTAQEDALKYQGAKKYSDTLDQSTFANRQADIENRGAAATQFAEQQAQVVRQQKLLAAQKAASALVSKAQSSLGQLAGGEGSTNSGYDLQGVNSQRQAVVNAAASQRGVDYHWGAESAGKGFDCSGLVQYAYRKAGLSIPRTSGQQAMLGKRTAIGNLQPGDLVAHPGHIAIYAGNGMMWEAPHTGAQVRLVPVRSDMYGVHINYGKL